MGKSKKVAPELLRRSRIAVGRDMTAEDREKLLKPYLPKKMPPSRPSPSSTSPSRADAEATSGSGSNLRRRKVVRPFVRDQVHVFLNTLLLFLFGIYVRIRIAYHATRDRIYAVLYYHHRTPEYIQRDIKDLSRLPEHLSVILELDQDEHNSAGLERLLNDLGEIAAWCACAGIPALSVYERSGILKRRLEVTHRSITRVFSSYFNPQNTPTLSVGAPSLQSYSPPPTPPSPNHNHHHHNHRDSASQASTSSISSSPSSSSPPHLKLLLLGEDDGRSTLVDLTKIFTEMAQQRKISPDDDVSSDLINVEISAAVMNEPDLLVLFSPQIILRGYPPWHLRLTEIFHVPDNTGVEYQVFLRALHRYAKAEMRLGR